LGIIIQTFVNNVVVGNLRIIGCMSTAYAQVTMVLWMHKTKSIYMEAERGNGHEWQNVLLNKVAGTIFVDWFQVGNVPMKIHIKNLGLKTKLAINTRSCTLDWITSFTVQRKTHTYIHTFRISISVSQTAGCGKSHEYTKYTNLQCKILQTLYKHVI
jgi:hypothetical protein